MLRTCSEPDLAKLTRTAEFAESNIGTRRKSLDLEKLKSEVCPFFFSYMTSKLQGQCFLTFQEIKLHFLDWKGFALM